MQEGSELKRRHAIKEAEEDRRQFFSAFRRLRWSQAPAPAALIMTQNSLEMGIAKMWRRVRRQRQAKFTLQERDIGGLKARPGRPSDARSYAWS